MPCEHTVTGEQQPKYNSHIVFDLYVGPCQHQQPAHLVVTHLARPYYRSIAILQQIVSIRVALFQDKIAALHPPHRFACPGQPWQRSAWPQYPHSPSLQPISTASPLAETKPMPSLLVTRLGACSEAREENNWVPHFQRCSLLFSPEAAQQRAHGLADMPATWQYFQPIEDDDR